jgi:ABC-type transport system substrate-binding protein
LYYAIETPALESASRIVKESLETVGIGTEVEAFESGSMRVVMLAEEDYDIAMRLNQSDPDPYAAIDWRLSCWSAPLDSGGNANNFCVDEFQAILDKVGTTFGEERLQNIYAMDQYVAKERPWIWLAGVNTIGAYRSDRIEIPTHDLWPDHGYLWGWWVSLNMKVK